MFHEFRLSAQGEGGVRCDEGGAFVGAIPMLARACRNGKDEWQPRDCGDLSEEMSAQYGLPIDMSSKRGGLAVISNTLNEGDLARAQIATVLLGVPDPPSLSKGAPSRSEMLKLADALRWSSLLKADWDPDAHPRWPAGAPSSQGGQFAPKGDGETGASPPQANTTRQAGSDNPRPDRALVDARFQLADAGASDASDDPTAQAVALAAEAQRNANAQATPANNEHQSFWERLGSELSEKTKASLVEIGRAGIQEGDAEFATGVAEIAPIVDALHAFNEYRAQPWLNADGQPHLTIAISTGDPDTDQGMMFGELLKPNPVLMRPATNADWVDPLVNLASLLTSLVGPELKLAAPAVETAAVVDRVAAESALATTEGVAISGSRAIDLGKSYEAAVREMYGDLPLNERSFKFFVNGKKVSIIADNTTLINGKLTAIEAKYVDDWPTSLRNPASQTGRKPWARAERKQMIQQAQAYSFYFPGGSIYHTNSVELATYYMKLFRRVRVGNFNFVITPAEMMSKLMAKNYMERIFGVGAFDYERKIPGTQPGEEASIRYLAFDDTASIPKLFDEALDRIEPNLMTSGAAILEGTRLELPDGSRFFAILLCEDLEGWRQQLELGAKELGLATARILSGDIIVSDGRSYPLSVCKVEYI